MSIGAGCDTKAVVEHELLHALGFYHEQSRSDRDDYVKIWWDQIEEGGPDMFLLCFVRIQTNQHQCSVHSVLNHIYMHLFQQMNKFAVSRQQWWIWDVC